MSNIDSLDSPGGPPDLAMVSFAVAPTMWDRGVLAEALVAAEEQFAFLPGGRVLRGVEPSRLARRLTAAAARAGLRPRLLRVFHTAVHLLVHFSRLIDGVALRQLATEAGLGPSASRKLGADLAELAALGLLLYRPGQGRGNTSMIGVPARFASDVLIRLRRDGRWAPPVAPSSGPIPANADAPTQDSTLADVAAVVECGNTTHQNTTHNEGVVPVHEGGNTAKRSPGGGVVSHLRRYISLSEKPPEPHGCASGSDRSIRTGAMLQQDAAGDGGDGGDGGECPVRAADIAWVLERLPSRLSTHGDARGRGCQAQAIRRALAEEFSREVILEWVSTATPAVVLAPAGFVAFRVARLLCSGESPRQRRLTMSEHRRREREKRAASRARAVQDAAWACRIFTEVPVHLVAGLARVATDRIRQSAERVFVTPRALAAMVGTLLRDALEVWSCTGEAVSLSQCAQVVMAQRGHAVSNLSATVGTAMRQAGGLEAAIAVLLRERDLP